MARLRLFACAVTLAWTASGCIGLSLFGSEHTHTHYHNEGEENPLFARLESLEQRLAKMESSDGVAHASAETGE